MSQSRSLRPISGATPPERASDQLRGLEHPPGRRWGPGRPARRIGAALLTVALIVGVVQAVAVPASHGAQAPTIAPTTTTATAAAGSTAGGWHTTAAGTVSAFGGAVSYGSITTPLNAPIIGMASTPDGRGYWLVGADGGVFTFGDATFYGGMATTHLNRPVVGIESTADGHGYWLVASDGGVFTFGDAVFHGGTGLLTLAAPIVGMEATPDGLGYWLVGADGGVFTFGDAIFYGGMALQTLAAPVVGMAATGDGHGYWLVGADGGVFTFGDAGFHGSEVGQGVGHTIIGLIPSTDGQGYTLVASTGATYPVGDAQVVTAQMRGGGMVDLPGSCNDWGTTSPCTNTGIPFVPMEWGAWCSGSSTCPALPASLAADGNQYLLTFNEPDNSGQSNMSVARAVQLWPALEATGLQLSSPAVTSGSSGTSWLASFMSQAHTQGLRVNFLALHWYGDCSNPQNLITYLAGMEASYGLPEWLTEFSCINDSAAVNASFLQQVAPKLAALPYLQRFAWFTNRPYSGGYQYTGLLGSSGALTAVGQAYTAIPSG